MKKFRVIKQCDYIQGHLRYGHLEGIVEAENEEEIKKMFSDNLFDDLDLVIDDYRVNDYKVSDEPLVIEEMNEEKVKRDNDFSLMCLCAFRYGLGRMTYITDFIPKFIKNNINKILDKDIEIMISEIEEANKRNNLGMNCDKKSWLEFKRFLEKEQFKRKVINKKESKKEYWEL